MSPLGDVVTPAGDRHARRVGVAGPGRGRQPGARERVLPGCEDPGVPTPVPLVIDTDPGIDDALAILLALCLAMLAFALLVISVDLLTGVTGMPTLGQVAYFGTGAYTAGLVGIHIIDNGFVQRY